MAERIPQSATIRVPLQAYQTGTTTAATGKTIAITISKNGGAYANPSAGATNATEIGSGSYYVDLSTTDTGTLGPLFVKGSVSGVDDVIAIYNVVKATNGGFTALPDAAAEAAGGLFTRGTGAGQINQTNNGQIDVNAARLGGTTQTGRDIGASVLLSSGTGTGQISLTSGLVTLAGVTHTGAVIPTVSAVTGLTASNLDVAVSTRLASASYTAPDNTTIANIYSAVDTEIGTLQTTATAIRAKTDNLPASPAATGDAMALTSSERNSVADALLARNVSGGSSTGRTVKQALHVLRNKTAISGGTLTVYDTDDTTTSFTASVTTAAGDPISSIDPA